MTIPMFDVSIRGKPPKWESVLDIHDLNDLVWFDDTNGWEVIHVPVTLNGITKDCDVFLISKNHGWAQWYDFFPNPIFKEKSNPNKE